MTSGMGIAETTPFSLNNPLPSDVKDNITTHTTPQLFSFFEHDKHWTKNRINKASGRSQIKRQEDVPCGHILNRYKWALLKAHDINECSLFADKLLAVLDQQTLGVVVNALTEHVVNRSVYIGSVNSEVFNS